MNILSYIFATNPGQAFKYYIPMWIFTALLIVGSLAFARIYKKLKKHDFAFKRLFKTTANRLLLFGILFLVLLLVRYESIPYFSMRIWLYASILWFLYFAYKTVRVYTKKYPIERENSKHKPKATKDEPTYLPNKKRR